MLGDVHRRIDLIDAIKDAMPVLRELRYVVHLQVAILAQRIISVAMGYQCLDDQESSMRVDPTL